MTALTIGRGSSATLVLSTAVATAAPTTEDGYTLTGDVGFIRTFLNYTGTVTACVIRLWLKDAAGVWYRGAASSDMAPLAPASGDEARDWLIGGNNTFMFQVESIAGGGTVVVTGVGVQA